MPKMLMRVLIRGSAMLVGSSKVIKVVMIAEKVTWYDNHDDGDDDDDDKFLYDGQGLVIMMIIILPPFIPG